MNHTTTSINADHAHDFDFLIGQWKVLNHRKVSYLESNSAWETFEATSDARTLPAGIGNYDEFVPIDWRPGFVGMSLRIFHPESQRWSIYWLDNKTGGIDGTTGQLNAPVVGGFVNEVGEFHGRETFEGTPVLVKFTWSGISTNSARWEQAFSTNDGETWETNWTMQFSRHAM